MRGDAEPCGWASESPRAIALAPCPGPACGGRHKGAFQAPPDHWGDCTYTPVPALCQGKPPAEQHPWGLPEGFGGPHPVLSAPGRWVPEQGVAGCSTPPTLEGGTSGTSTPLLVPPPPISGSKSGCASCHHRARWVW